MGSLSEGIDFSSIVNDAQSPLRLSFEDVERINSVGIRATAQMLAAIAHRDVEIINVPVPIIDMVNSLPSFFGKHASRIKSLFVPMSCSQCSVSSDLIVQRDEIKFTNRGFTTPLRRCVSCGASMRYAVMPEDYLLFIAHES